MSSHLVVVDLRNHLGIDLRNLLDHLLRNHLVAVVVRNLLLHFEDSFERYDPIRYICSKLEELLQRRNLPIAVGNLERLRQGFEDTPETTQVQEW